MREALTAPSSHQVLLRPARRTKSTIVQAQRSRPRIVGARLAMSAPATARLVQVIATGVDEFVITSADGRLSVRARLTIDSVDFAEQCLPGSNVVVDWPRATISNEGICVRLARTELRLLSALLENNGQAVRRETLIERAWPRRKLRAGESENALAVYVCALRKRLAAIGLANALQTIRGVGYRIAL
jgi:DNA-binding response OmpR family regulator